jgi:hypothetical protein
MTQTIAVADLRPGDCFTSQLVTGAVASSYVTDVIVSEHAVILHTLRYAYDAVESHQRLYPLDASITFTGSATEGGACAGCGSEDDYHWSDCTVTYGAGDEADAE